MLLVRHARGRRRGVLGRHAHAKAQLDPAHHAQTGKEGQDVTSTGQPHEPEILHPDITGETIDAGICRTCSEPVAYESDEVDPAIIGGGK